MRLSLKNSTKVLAVVATLGMFVVLVMGATVTNTGSEHGCGRSWPLCRGQLIPQLAVRTAIEFSHRAVVGIESVLIIALAISSLYLYWSRREIRVLAPLMVIFLFLQAGLGAWAVMYPQLSVVLALHFGVSLIAFASVLLTTVFLFELSGFDELRERPVPGPFRRFVFGVTAYSYFVVYVGAYVRHTHADLACSGWPLCNGALVPELYPAVAAAFIHRIAALLLLVALVALALWSSKLRVRRPDLYWGSLVALSVGLLQAFAGAAVVWSGLDLFSALAHAALAGLLFASLAYLCLHVLAQFSRLAEPSASPLLAATPLRGPISESS